MARSLTVKHTETPGTSGLFNLFLALAFGWLLVSMLVAGAQANPASPDVPVSGIVAE